MRRPPKPARTVARAKKLRRKMSLPEVLLWRELQRAPDGLRFRKQHPAGVFVIDFFCARANLAIEVDGISHDMGDRPVRDEKRDVWLREHRIDTVRIPAREVLKDAGAVAESIGAMVCDRLVLIGKTPPSALPEGQFILSGRPAGQPKGAATSPSRDDGEDF